MYRFYSKAKECNVKNNQEDLVTSIYFVEESSSLTKNEAKKSRISILVIIIVDHDLLETTTS